MDFLVWRFAFLPLIGQGRTSENDWTFTFLEHNLDRNSNTIYITSYLAQCILRFQQWDRPVKKVNGVGLTQQQIFQFKPQRFFTNSKNPQSLPGNHSFGHSMVPFWAGKIFIFSHNPDLSTFMLSWWCNAYDYLSASWVQNELWWVHFSACEVHNKVFFASTGVKLT